MKRPALFADGTTIGERLSQRTTGAVLAMTVQALFVTALLWWAVPPLSRIRPQREIIFHLMPTPPAPPVRIIGATAPARKPRPSIPFTVAPSNVAPSSVSPSAPPSGIAGFGQSLFGCAPENFANRTPDARAHCAKPGEGMALNQPDGLMHGRTHVKDNARWANAMAHKQTLPMLPGGMLFPLVALEAAVDGSITEPSGAFRDPEQWPAERDPQQFMPRSLDEQDHIYDAWRKDHPAPSSPSAQH